jgi:competence protein ComEA
MDYLMKIALILCVFCFMTGCGSDNSVYIEQAASEEAAAKASEDAEQIDIPADADDTAGSTETLDPVEIYVYVCGAVEDPGVYRLESGQRMYEAIELAGGFSEDACEDAVNLAGELCDGQMIWIPTMEEAAAGGLDAASAVWGASSQDTAETDDRININTATSEQLMTLPGIGQSKADSIVAYRDCNGSFASVEEIMNVDGIKEGVYNRIKDSIRVK